VTLRGASGLGPRASGFAAVLAVLGLALGLGFRDAGAAATGYQPPAGWRELPDLVIAAPPAQGAAITFRGGWGDPGAGCFLLGQVATVGPGGTPAAIYAAMTTGLREAGFELRPTQAAAAATAVLLELAGGAFTALVAGDAAVGDDRAGVTARVAACFFNQRQPETSRQLCERELKRFVAAR